MQFVSGRASILNKGSLIPETLFLNIMKYCWYAECNFPILLSTKLGNIMTIIKISMLPITAIAY